MAFDLDKNLKQYATEEQWKKLEAWEKFQSKRLAANALGISHKGLYKALMAVKKKAAQKGYAPDYDLTHPVAPGMSSKGTSIRYDGNGNIDQIWNKTKLEGRDPDEVIKLPDPKTIVKLSTLYDQEGNVTQQWIAEKPEAVAQAHAWEVWAEELAADLPRVPEMKVPQCETTDFISLYPVGDHHLGMLSWDKETGSDYDLSIGEKLLKDCGDFLINSSPASEEAAVIFLGDFMHYDSFEPVTPTHRNQLDADSRFPKMVRTAVRSMRHMIESAYKKHSKVHVIVEIGNHDLSSSIFLMECLSNIYEHNPNIIIDTSPRHYHYLRFGKNLVGTHHGHGTKMEKLPMIMANDRKEDWGETEFRYWLTGHIHQKKSLDFPGCSVESMRVLPPSDAYADQSGYRPHRDMRSIILHKDFGEVCRQVVNPKMFGVE